MFSQSFLPFFSCLLSPMGHCLFSPMGHSCEPPLPLKDPEVAARNPRSGSALWSGEVVALWKEVQTRLENRY